MTQEKIKEAAKEYVKNFAPSVKSARGLGFVDGAKWLQERMYSEEEVLNLLYERESELNTHNSIFDYQDAKEWFEQFKKK